MRVQLEPKKWLQGGLYGSKILDLLKCIFCIQATDVDLDAAVLPDATTTSGVSDVDASPSHMNELSLITD